MRPVLLASLAILALGSLPVLSGDGPPAASPTVTKPPAKVARTAPKEDFPEREQAALGFVREHHPELAALLEQLKPMRPVEYERAVNELDQVRRSLETLKEHNEPRYQVGLEVWKARSKVQVLAAKLVSAPSPELEGQLRAAIENQLDSELRQHRLEREIVEARLRKISEEIDRLDKNRDKIVESRFHGLLKKGQRARRQQEAGAKGEN